MSFLINFFYKLIAHHNNLNCCSPSRFFFCQQSPINSTSYLMPTPGISVQKRSFIISRFKGVKSFKVSLDVQPVAGGTSFETY